MADRTAARAFSLVFQELADAQKLGTPGMATLAAKIFEHTSSFDFSTDQMGCDGALWELAIASECSKHNEILLPGGTCWECEQEKEG